jgi:hypothetical protein
VIASLSPLPSPTPAPERARVPATCPLECRGPAGRRHGHERDRSPDFGRKNVQSTCSAPRHDLRTSLTVAPGQLLSCAR